GDLRELITGEREHLRGPQRAELRDGEDLAVGRPLLPGPPMLAVWGGFQRLPCRVYRSPSGAEPALPGLSPKLGLRLGRHWRRSPSGIGQGPGRDLSDSHT